MKKFLLVLLGLFMVLSLYANDTYFSLTGGSLVPADYEENSIQMKEELIHIQLEDDYYEVTVDFQFYNYGETVNLIVGFPFLCDGLNGEGKIYDFKCWTDGKETSYVDSPISMEWKKITDLQNAYIREIKFKKNKITKTRIQYKSSYAHGSPSFNIAEYLYGTGKPWKNSIGKLTLQIDNRCTYTKVSEVSMADKEIETKNFIRLSDTLFECVFYDVEPEKLSESFYIYCENCIMDTGPRAFPAYFFYIERLATEDDIFWMSSKHLRLARNMIYALHGYEFKSTDINEYIKRNDEYWRTPYKVNPDFSEDDFSEIEKANIQFLLEHEKKLSKYKK